MSKTKPPDLSQERWAVGNRKKMSNDGGEYRMLRDSKGAWIGSLRDNSSEDSAGIALMLAAPALLSACRTALDHITELRDAWMRGVISEKDGKGGTRSNRNVDVETFLRAAIAKTQID